MTWKDKKEKYENKDDSLLESDVSKNLFSYNKKDKTAAKKIVQKYKKVLLNYDQLYRYFSDRVSTQNNGFSNSFNKNIGYRV